MDNRSVAPRHYVALHIELHKEAAWCFEQILEAAAAAAAAAAVPTISQTIQLRRTIHARHC